MTVGSLELFAAGSMAVAETPTTCPLSLRSRAIGTQAGEGPQIDVRSHGDGSMHRYRPRKVRI